MWLGSYFFVLGTMDMEFMQACGSDMTVNSNLIAFEQKLFEIVTKYPLQYDSSWRY